MKADQRLRNEAVHATFLQCTMDALFQVSDCFLEPGGSLDFSSESLPTTLLIPLVGGIRVSENGDSGMLLSEELLATGVTSFSNDFDSDNVNVLVLQLQQGLWDHEPGASRFNLNQKNVLCPTEDFGNQAQVGVFESRVKGHLQLEPGLNSALFFVINGSFEIDDRLLEYRDALFLWDIASVDFEALSEAAILLVIQFEIQS